MYWLFPTREEENCRLQNYGWKPK
uniref:Uncharacterized protein n=1 Tax=Rhizophora mucronata TaxID=61149 RepID=A0A2P2IZY2_RHIMU